jgi:hypothetical protein
MLILLSQNNTVSQLKADGQPMEGQIYCYDQVFDQTSSTMDVYQGVGNDILKGVVNGINGTIFACEPSRPFSHPPRLIVSLQMVKPHQEKLSPC